MVRRSASIVGSFVIDLEVGLAQARKLVAQFRKFLRRELFLGTVPPITRHWLALGRNLLAYRFGEDREPMAAKDYDFKFMEARGFGIDSGIHDRPSTERAHKLESAWSGSNGDGHPFSMFAFCSPSG
jgi:hypothetical protein